MTADFEEQYDEIEIIPLENADKIARQITEILCGMHHGQIIKLFADIISSILLANSKEEPNISPDDIDDYREFSHQIIAFIIDKSGKIRTQHE